jgi:hypothetical protein
MKKNPAVTIRLKMMPGGEPNAGASVLKALQSTVTTTLDLSTPKSRIFSRIASLEGIRANYRRYQADRVTEQDHHGAWDAAVNLAETEAEIAGLKFAIESIDKGTSA